MTVFKVQFLLLAASVVAQAYVINERVAAAVDNPDGNLYLHRGDQGRVACIFTSSEYYDVLIEWDRWIGGHSGFGSCSGKAASGRGWAVKSWMIQSITTTIGPPVPTTPTNSTSRWFQSPNHTVVFWDDYVPMVYTWSAGLTARYTTSWDYSRGTTMVNLSQVDQSVIMPAAANWNAPCDVQLAISTDVLENRAQYVQTIFVARPGSYLYSSGTLVTGGITDLSLRVSNPRLRTSATAAARECYGWSSFQWTSDLP